MDCVGIWFAVGGCGVKFSGIRILYLYGAEESV